MEQKSDERCENCIFFIDYRATETEPDECNGYCCNPTGNEEYGGHWTHHESWCRLYVRIKENDNK